MNIWSIYLAGEGVVGGQEVGGATCNWCSFCVWWINLYFFISEGWHSVYADSVTVCVLHACCCMYTSHYFISSSYHSKDSLNPAGLFNSSWSEFSFISCTMFLWWFYMTYSKDDRNLSRLLLFFTSCDSEQVSVSYHFRKLHKETLTNKCFIYILYPLLNIIWMNPHWINVHTGFTMFQLI